MKSNAAGTLIAASGCLAASAMTIGVAIADPADGLFALGISGVVALGAMSMGRQVADNDDDASDREPTVAQDPTQRRIDEVLTMMKQRILTADQGAQLIEKLQAAHTASPYGAPPYGAPPVGDH